jgi:hypothetical protein
MFLVTNRTGTVFDHIWLVEGIGPFILFEVAGFAIFINRSKGDAVMDSIR